MFVHQFVDWAYSLIRKNGQKNMTKDTVKDSQGTSWSFVDSIREQTMVVLSQGLLAIIGVEVRGEIAGSC